MSHIANIQTEIKNLNALKKACETLGFTFKENQKTYKWYGRFMNDYPLPENVKPEDLGKCDHAINVPNAKYEVGVIKNKDGNSYELRWDFWCNGGLNEKIGRNGEILKQAYAVEVATEAAQNEGYFVTKTKEKNGDIILKIMV